MDVVKAKADRGDIAGAQSLIAEIGKGWVQEQAVMEVGEAHLLQGDSKSALASARSISSPRRLGLLTRVDVAFEEQGNPAAKGLFDEILLATQSLGLDDDYDSTVHGVALAFTESGRVERGIEIARGARIAQARSRALRGIASWLHEQNKKTADVVPAPRTDHSPAP